MRPHWKTLIQLLRIWLLLCLCGNAMASPSVVVSHATLAQGLCSEHHAEFKVALPDDWKSHHFKAPDTACYRFKLVLAQSPTTAWALRIDRLPGNHRITVNGTQLTTRHMQGPQITSMGTLPYLIDLPVNVLIEGENDIDIDVRMNPFRKPGISPLSAGPVEAMRPDFETWEWLTVDLPKTLNWSVVGMALFILLAWRARPADKVFAYFGGLMLVMSARNAFSYQETIAWNPFVVDWLYFAAHAATAYFLAGFGLTYAKVDMRRIINPIRALLGLVLVAGAFLAGTRHMDDLRLVSYPLMMLGGVVVIIKWIQAAWRHHWLEGIAMTAGPVITYISVAHDYLFLTPYVSVTDLNWSPYSAPFIFLGYALTLMRKFVATMNFSEQLNIHLEARVAERTRELEAANESKTRFLASASHDLRQPTAAIGLLVSLLRRQPLPPAVKDLTHMLDQAVSSMESLLVGLLDVSRLDAGAVQVQWQAVCMKDVIQAIQVHEQSAAQSKGLELRFRFPKTSGPNLTVWSDPVLVHGVIRNLVSNAIRYTPQGGVLVALRLRSPNRLRIEVWDTGVGVAADQQSRIFEEFYQVGNTARDRSRGIGLGLAIVRRTAALLGEAVTLRSTVGKGSCFAIELPLHQGQLIQTPPLASSSHPLANRNVWVVEDDLLVRRALSEMLQSWGAHVMTWTQGDALLDELPQLLSSPDRHKRPDILISDYRLPGLNGIELSQTIQTYLRGSGMHLRTIIMSGDTAPDDMGRLHASGLPILAKPCRSELLLEQLLALDEAKAA